jgi:Uma2 family endonuclease
MAENTVQFRWIVTVETGLDAQFAEDRQVFVAGDLFWYPVEGHPEIKQAPDILVVFGRPKGDRGSYKQWEEGNIPVTVTWEILSPGKRVRKLVEKFQFYEQHGVEEYYVFDPDDQEMTVYVRVGDRLRAVEDLTNWVSPRLGIRFDFSGPEMLVIGPDGQPFLTALELAAKRKEEQLAREQAQRDAEQAQREVAEAKEKAERLAAQLRALGIEPQA